MDKVTKICYNYIMKINIKNNAKHFKVRYPAQRSEWVFIMPTLGIEQHRLKQQRWYEKVFMRFGLHS